MGAADANVLVRLLVADDPVQTKRAVAFLEAHRPLLDIHRRPGGNCLGANDSISLVQGAGSGHVARCHKRPGLCFPGRGYGADSGPCLCIE